MPRTARAPVGGVCYHVMNRGDERRELFFNNDDYAGFVGLWDNPARPFWPQEGPVPRPHPWIDTVNLPQTRAELEAIRRSIDRGAPLGDLDWVRQTARRLGLEYTLNPRGRPRKKPKAKNWNVPFPLIRKHQWKGRACSINDRPPAP